MTPGFFGASSYLALGCPGHLPVHSDCQLGEPRKVTEGAGLAERFYRNAWDRLDRAGAVDTGLGRGDLWKAVIAISSFYNSSPSTSKALPLIADRQSYPARAGLIPLFDINACKLRSALEDPSEICLQVPNGLWPRLRMPEPRASST